MFSTSKDILYLVLTIAIALVTVFGVWLLWYLIAILRDARKMVGDVRTGFDKVHEILDAIKQAAVASTTHLSLIVGTVERLISFYQKRQRGKRARSSDSAEEPKTGKR